MTERYDSATAKHYAAYRPPLHRLILERVINSSESFTSGSDIGCGTGYSTVALAEYCDRVCGIDNSQQMLEFVEPHAKIVYRLGAVDSFGDLPGRPYDVVTFAGSLFYAKSLELRRALCSVCSSYASVIVYDFNALLDEFLQCAGVAASHEKREYDYDVGLSDWDEFEVAVVDSDRIRIKAYPEDVAHALLSDSLRYDHLQRIMGSPDVFENLVSRLKNKNGSIHLETDIWIKRYRLTLEN